MSPPRIPTVPALLLLPLPLNVEIPFLAPDIQCALPFEHIPVDHKFVFDVETITSHHTLSREHQFPFLQFQVLEWRLLLVRPTHCAGDLIPVLLDRQGRCPLLVANIVLALPRSDRICLVRRNGEAADHEYQRHGQNRLQQGAVVYALEEYAPDSGNFSHHCLHTHELSLILAAFHCLDILPPPNATALWRGIPGLPPGRLSVLRRRLLACSPKGLPAPFVRFVSRRCGPDV